MTLEEIKNRYSESSEEPRRYWIPGEPVIGRDLTWLIKTVVNLQWKNKLLKDCLIDLYEILRDLLKDTRFTLFYNLLSSWIRFLVTISSTNSLNPFQKSNATMKRMGIIASGGNS